MKRITAIHDMSGIGKCSLTAAIPVISSCGLECNPVPTAVLSTHTGGISGYTFTDLTDGMRDYCNHWHNIGIKPDAIYTGYLGSEKQVEIVNDIIDMLGGKETVIIVDPAMADSGILYKGFNSSFPSKMAELCRKADCIVPNITEASLLTGIEFREEYDENYIDNLISSLSPLTKRYIILTGVSFEEERTGCMVYDKSTDRKDYISTEKYPGVYYGTGDLFASVVASGLTKGYDCFRSAAVAAEFTAKSICETYRTGTDPRFGVAFEYYLSYLTEQFGGKI